MSRTLLLSVLCLVITANSGNAENILETFLWGKLNLYSDWIKAKNLDPSQPVTGPTHLSSSGLFANLDCYLSNHVIRQHSDGINVTSIKANLETITITFTIQENITFEGDYVANGTVGFPTTPLEANGKWHISLPQITLRNVYFNYSISSAGLVQITNYDMNGVIMPSWYEREWEAHFENLWDEGEAAEYKDSIKDGLYESFRDYLIRDTEHPLKQLFVQYLEEFFSEKQWADIILNTLPPSCTNNTFTTVPTTTPVPTTTATTVTTTSTAKSTTPTTASRSTLPITSIPSSSGTTLEHETDNILEAFVRRKLDRYGTWLWENQQDPSPALLGPTYVNSTTLFVSVECFLSNHIVRDHSQSVNFTEVKANLSTISLSFEIQDNVTFSGKYAANGTAGFQRVEFFGEGDWRVIFPGMSFRNILFNYTITQSGYLQITSYDFTGVDLPSHYNRKAEVYFQNLWEDEEVVDEAEYIQDAIYDGFSTYLKEDREHPIKRQYLQYFQEIFKNTTWAEIILPSTPSVATTATEPTSTPDTTFPTSPETTTLSLPTTSPSSSGNAANQGASVLLLVLFVATCIMQ